MPSGRRKKQWHEMTHREIVSALVAFAVVGIAIIVAMVFSISDWHEWHPFLLLWPGAGMLFVVSIVSLGYVQALRELQRRRLNNRDSR